jgi:hypothetical protein
MVCSRRPGRHAARQPDLCTLEQQDEGVPGAWVTNVGSAAGVRGGEPTPSATQPPNGVKTYAVFNCHTERRPLAMWIKDDNGTAGWVSSGMLEQQYDSSGSCPGSNAPWTTTLIAGHNYQIEAVDYSAADCSNDPQLGQCIRSHAVIRGGSSGTATSTIS